MRDRLSVDAILFSDSIVHSYSVYSTLCYGRSIVVVTSFSTRGGGALRFVLAGE